MTLHDTTELGKKAALGTAAGIVGAIILFVFVKVAVLMKDIIFPPKVQPPTMSYNKLPAIKFPKSTVAGNFTYSLNTNSGGVPDLHDRIVVFPITHNSPNLLNLDKVKTKVGAVGFTTQDGNVYPETALGGPYYEWDNPTGINKKIHFNIVSFDFNLTSNYLSSLTVLGAQYLSDQPSAVQTASDFLDAMTQLPTDVDLDKSQTQHPDTHYVTFPQLFSIQNGSLVPTTSLSKAQVIRVDLYQKDIEYDLNTGKSSANNVLITSHMKLPILYPNPPYSTMTFWVASGTNQAEIVDADYTHQDIDQTNQNATYPIITPLQALDELKKGQGYVASYFGHSSNILINSVYLAYYMGKDPQDYLMPVIVFEGDNGFFAYVSAVSSDWIQ